VRNRSTAGGTVREADPDFARVLVLLREVQAAGAFGMRVEEDKPKAQPRDILPPRRRRPGHRGKGAEIRRLLKMSPVREKFCSPIHRRAGRTTNLPETAGQSFK
jgi:hypothetical protein